LRWWLVKGIEAHRRSRRRLLIISILAGSGSEDGVGDTSVAGTVVLKGLHLSAAEGDTEEGLSFAWT